MSPYPAYHTWHPNLELSAMPLEPLLFLSVSDLLTGLASFLHCFAPYLPVLLLWVFPIFLFSAFQTRIYVWAPSAVQWQG